MRISAGLYKWRLLWRSQLAARSLQLATGNSQLATHNSCVKRDNGGFSFNKATRQAFLPATPAATQHQLPQPHPVSSTRYSWPASMESNHFFGFGFSFLCVHLATRLACTPFSPGFSCFWLFLTVSPTVAVVVVVVVVWLCTWFLGKAANNIFVWLWRCCNCNGYSICLTNIRWREWERDDDDGETFSPSSREREREWAREIERHRETESNSRDCQISKLLAGIMRIFVWAALRLVTGDWRLGSV